METVALGDSRIEVQIFPHSRAGGLAPPILKNTDVHVWHCELPASSAEIARLEASLSGDERDRAARYRFERHRNDFTVCRGVLRQLLAGYLGVQAEDVGFSYASFGKPGVADSYSKIKFNLSHTDGMAVFAFALDREVGIDVEKIRSDVEVDMISRRFFALEERTAIMALPKDQRYEAFFRCWTRKEAYIKALGEGLSMPLDQFTVSVEGPAMIVSNERDPGEVSRWSFFELNLDPRYASTLAAAKIT